MGILQQTASSELGHIQAYDIHKSRSYRDFTSNIATLTSTNISLQMSRGTG